MDTLHKRGRPFAVGNRSSKGRPDGSRNKVTLACEELMEGEGEAITRQAIDMAKEGDHFAMKLCMDRFYPPRRERRRWPRLRGGPGPPDGPARVCFFPVRAEEEGQSPGGGAERSQKLVVF